MTTGLAFGLIPALRAGRSRATLVHSARTTTGHNERLRGALMVAEIALSLMLLAAAGLLARSFLKLRAVDPGFVATDVLTVTVDLPPTVYADLPSVMSFHSRTLEKLAGLPGVVSASAVNYLPLGMNLHTSSLTLAGGRTLPKGFEADTLAVSPEYFRTLGIRMTSGREFSSHDSERAPRVAIVSRSLAKDAWPSADAVGQQIAMEDHPKPGDWLTVVGVVDDVKQMGLDAGANAALYQPYGQVAAPALTHMTFAVRHRPGDGGIAPAIRTVMREVDPNQPVPSIISMQELMLNTISDRRFQARLIAVFALFALSLTVVGIYGVLAYNVSQRIREFGVRLALGASPGSIVSMVVRRTLALTGTGILIGAAGALALTRLLKEFLFAVEPTDPVTFATVVVLVILAAIAAAVVPARRAASVDPVIALQAE